MILPQSWTGMMEHFDTLCNCDNHIRQNGTSSADSVDCERDVFGPKLEGLPCALKIAISLATSLCVPVFRALLEEDTALMFPCLLFRR